MGDSLRDALSEYIEELRARREQDILISSGNGEAIVAAYRTRTAVIHRLEAILSPGEQ